MEEKTLNEIGYSSYEKMREEMLDKDAFDRSKWELTMTAPMRLTGLSCFNPITGTRPAEASATRRRTPCEST